MKTGIWGVALAVALVVAACGSSNQVDLTMDGETVLDEPGRPGAGRAAVIATPDAGIYYSTATSAGILPSCPDPPESVTRSTGSYLDAVDLWVEVPLSILGDAMASSSPDPRRPDYLTLGGNGLATANDALETASMVGGRRYPQAFAAWIWLPGWDQLVDFAAGAEALVALRELDARTGAVEYVVTPTWDGGFAVSGPCDAVAQLAAIGAYAASIEARPYETFRAVAGEQEARNAFTRWSETR